MQRGVFIALVHLALIALAFGGRKCPCNAKNHEVYTNCLRTCGNNCESQGKIINCPNESTANCKPGCACAKGYTRLNDKANSPCVRISSCPSNQKVLRDGVWLK